MDFKQFLKLEKTRLDKDLEAKGLLTYEPDPDNAGRTKKVYKKGANLKLPSGPNFAKNVGVGKVLSTLKSQPADKLGAKKPGQNAPPKKTVLQKVSQGIKQRAGEVKQRAGQALEKDPEFQQAKRYSQGGKTLVGKAYRRTVGTPIKAYRGYQVAAKGALRKAGSGVLGGALAAGVRGLSHLGTMHYGALQRKGVSIPGVGDERRPAPEKLPTSPDADDLAGELNKNNKKKLKVTGGR